MRTICLIRSPRQSPFLLLAVFLLAPYLSWAGTAPATKLFISGTPALEKPAPMIRSIIVSISAFVSKPSCLHCRR